MSKNDAIILFGKYPREGFVKTRLALTIGDTKATDFYRRCLLEIFAEVERLTDRFDVFFYFAEAEEEKGVRKLSPPSFNLVAQSNTTLTNRIQLAFEQVFNLGYERVQIFSTDVPELNAKIIQNGNDQLIDNDCVVGPDSDGGYYCLGMRLYRPELLKVVYGSKDGMLNQTIQNAKRHNFSYATLPEISDIDTYKDLQLFKLRNPILWARNYSKLI